jgi:PAS domain S-box-containing protein
MQPAYADRFVVDLRSLIGCDGSPAQLEAALRFQADLDPTWAVVPRRSELAEHAWELAMSAPGGALLSRAVGERWDIAAVLRVSIGLASSLRKLHYRRLVHNQLAPGAVFVNVQTGQVWLHDFSQATRLASPGGYPDAHVFATDLRALGATVRTLLRDREDIPPQLSALISKLMSLQSYQSAASVEVDLRMCLDDWERAQRIRPFVLGARREQQPRRPVRLYGRRSDLERLVSAHARLRATGNFELVVVSGPAGSGKSALVRELANHVLAEGQLIGSATFDRFRPDAPYWTLARAVGSVVPQILERSAQDIAAYRAVIEQALGDDAALGLTLVPELAPLVAAPAEAAIVPSRIQPVLAGLVRALARADSPFTMFLDDLQWADAETVDLIGALARGEVRHLLLIGAHRDGEVGPDHPLARMLATFRASMLTAIAVPLAPLARDDLTQLVADALERPDTEVQGLVEFVARKTKGNPFFAVELLATLADEGFLVYDSTALAWQWDLPRMLARGFSEDSTDLLVSRLAGLPTSTRTLLQQLACLGTAVERAKLALATGLDPLAIERELGAAEARMLVARRDTRYAFTHDRVHEAIYSAIAPGVLPSMHLEIGRALWARPASGTLFEISNHLLRGADLLVTADARREVARLALDTAWLARRANACSVAVSYLAAGAALVGPDERELSCEIDLLWGECAMLGAAPELAEQRFVRVVRDAPTLSLQTTSACRLSELHWSRGRPDAAVAVCCEQLQRLGHPLPARPSPAVVARARARVELQLAVRPLDTVDALPAMSDPRALATMELLLAILAPASLLAVELLDLAVLEMVALSIAHGIAPSTCVALAQLARIHAGQPAAVTAARLARELADRGNDARMRGRVLQTLAWDVVPWLEHVSKAQALMRSSQALALEAGDLSNLAHCLLRAVPLSILAGEPLELAHGQLDEALALATAREIALVIPYLRYLRRWLEGQRGLAPSPGVVDPECTVVPRWSFCVLDLMTCVTALDREGALAALTTAEALASPRQPSPEWAAYRLFAALAHALAEDPEAMAPHAAALARWADSCPETFASQASLVAAELARLEGRELEAAALYERAVLAAREHGLLHVQAFALERAADLAVRQGRELGARHLLGEARAACVRYGATATVRRLARDPRVASAETIGPARAFELATGLAELRDVEALVARIALDCASQMGATRGVVQSSVLEIRVLHAEAVRAPDGALSARMVDATSAEPALAHVRRTRQLVNLGSASRPAAIDWDSLRVGSVLCLPIEANDELLGALYVEHATLTDAFSSSQIVALTAFARHAAQALINARALSRLARRNEHLSHAQELSKTGSYLWSLTDNTVDWSDELRRIYGFGPDRDHAADEVLDMTHPHDQERVRTMVASVIRDRQDSSTEFRIITAAGEHKHLRSAARFRDSEAGPEFMGAIIDITEAKRAEAEHEQVRALAADAQRLSKTGSMLWNVTTGESFWSAESYVIYGVDPSVKASAQLVLSRIHPDDLERVTRQVEVVMSKGEDWISEFRMVMPNGFVKDVQVLARIRDWEAGNREYVGVIMDVTAARQAEALRRDKERAEEANEAKDQFLANVSHEIRTPMNAISGMTELMLDDALTAAQRERLKIVKTAADNLLGIIDDLLDFSKIEARDVELQVAALSLRATVDQVVQTLALRAEHKRLALSAHVDAALPDTLLGDVGRLRQVLINLLGNAIKFTVEGAVDVRANLVAERDGRVAIAFVVRDTGIGIPRDKQVAIFHPFTQEDSSTTRAYGGTGLGLAIAARLATAMGGGIVVDSEVGRGSTFTFTAWFERHGVADAAATSLPQRAWPASARRRVLVAEDNEFNAELVRQLLTRRGHAAVIVNRGEDVLRAITEHERFDVLLLDLHMPGLDGFGVIERLRGHERLTGEHLPVIAVTARARREDRDHCLASGMDAFLPKPVKPDALWLAIEQVTAARPR